MKSNMKKNLMKLGVMLAATFTLASCAEEITTSPEPEVVKNPYTIYADAPETKTVNNGLGTSWAVNDSICVWHAPAGTFDISYVTPFYVTDVDAGRFDTEYLNGEPVVQNDWYVFYPYLSVKNIEYPYTMAETNSWFAVGSQANALQIQTGNDSMAHIAGPDYPMYGIARAVESSEFPDVMMSHLSALVEVKVTNNADAPAAVTSVMLTAPEDIVGTYFIDITSDDPVFTPSGEKYVSDIAILAVKDAEPIAIGATSSFYLAIKPFTAPSGSELTIDVNGTKKTITLSEDVTFSSGKIKTLNFNYDEIIEPKETIQEGTYWFVADYEGAEYYAAPHKKGTNYGYLSAEDEGWADNAFKFTAVRGGGFTIQQADGRYLYLAGTYNSFNVSAELPEVGGLWYAYVNDDGTHEIINADKFKTIYYSSSYGNFAAYAKQSDVDFYPTLISAEGAEERPVFNLSTTSISVDADVTSVEFAIESNLDWTVSVDNGADVYPSEGYGDAVVTVTFSENTDSSPVKYTVTATSDLGDKVLTITQAGVQADNEVVDILNNALTGVSGTNYKDWSGKTSNSDAVYAGQSAGDAKTIQLRSKNNNSGIVTTSSGGYVTKISVVWNSKTNNQRVLQVYGKSDPYSSPTELYNSSTSGELLGEIKYGQSELVISGAYSYIGMKSKSSAMYLDEIRVTWSGDWNDGEQGGDEPEQPEIDFEGDGESAETAYTINDAKAYYAAGLDATVKKWVKGTIIGSYMNNTLLEGTDGASATNMVIGTPDNHVVVQLPKGDVRSALNLVDNPDNYEVEVAVYGTIEAYFQVAGVKNVTEYAFL